MRLSRMIILTGLIRAYTWGRQETDRVRTTVFPRHGTCCSAKVGEADAMARQAFKSGKILGKTRKTRNPTRTSQVFEQKW